MRRLLATLLLSPAAILTIPGPPAHADICAYPGVGVGARVIFPYGGFCDYPTEINGSHMHCEIGGAGLGGGISGSGDSVTASLGGLGVGGASCTWRCPDGTMAPAPNPPGAWKSYLVVMDSTNFCRDHMDPNGIWSAPVLPSEGTSTPPTPPQIAPGTPNN